MTEASEDGNHVVRVRAQVMMRDDSTGGWVPMGGGGLSNVSVRKRDISRDNDEHKHEYLIFGKRISDQSVVLSCIIKKDFEYYKVMPTFHHWKTGDKKFGLTFQTAADARAFDKGVRMAVEELLDGLSEISPLHKFKAGVGEDDVFMTLNLPVEIGDSRSSSDSSKGGGGSSHRATSPTESHHLHRIHYIPRRDKMGSDQDRSPPESKQLQQHEEGGDGVRSSEKETYSYVQLTAMHEYIYPVMEDQKASRRDSASSLKKRSLEVIPTQPPLLPTKPGGKKTDRHAAYWNRCRHCQELYLEGENGRGSCEYAPDCVRAGINAVACISCAECMLYHCMADAEGDFAQHPCECGVVDENCGRRWVGLALLSLLVPCLWCYPPLRACHWCCVSCGICGGRHRPAS
ncbi:sprouty-related, EVH1 domain-containing protein 2 isoform X5 [Zootermopsis nevadensis]|uniref:sprouty-related, EVH1 domain-containing protein 2 isoform X5 n=1 Tax=Zootermopsis nevadensis TaxID=136037 RepID=UPI000B8E43B0|nr:sprouty-related, EVH1 domain-containing protein 2 isoform X5 [Zootermopsis nevadensis]